MNLNNSKGLLITGGTGSFGTSFVQEVLHKYPKLPRLVIYSRDEYKQWLMRDKFPLDKYPQIRFFLGDIRDFSRLSRALWGIDTVIHAAALKQVNTAEYNPIEFVKTNVLGTENIVQACLDNKVKKLISLSTDKASAPINLYGATKLCSDKLVIAANNIKGKTDSRFSVVRYGNVFGSRGSVIPYFLSQAKNCVLPITNEDMTRFNILLKDCVDLVFHAIENSLGGEIFVPKIPSYRITDLAEAISPSAKKPICGIRPGEKIHEEMITIADSAYTVEMEKIYAILPSDGELMKKYLSLDCKPIQVRKNFSYNSHDNDKFLTVQEIRNLIIENIDKEFTPL